MGLRVEGIIWWKALGARHGKGGWRRKDGIPGASERGSQILPGSLHLSTSMPWEARTKLPLLVIDIQKRSLIMAPARPCRRAMASSMPRCHALP